MFLRNKETERERRGESAVMRLVENREGEK